MVIKKLRVLLFGVLLCVLLLLIFRGKEYILKGQSNKMEHKIQKVDLITSKQDEQLDFDPDGYYIPSADLIIGDYQIDHFYLETSIYDIKTSTLKKLEKPNAYIGLTNSITKRFELYSCPNPQISKSKLFIKSESTPIGIITIEGDFSDNIKSYFVTVFTGVVSVEEEGRVQNLGKCDFTYSEGD
ncbi:MAG: hypothetical protein GX075_11650 [Firmicutes bacterium]|nr:hypothetical protein [Bacillota bacterium]